MKDGAVALGRVYIRFATNCLITNCCVHLLHKVTAMGTNVGKDNKHTHHIIQLFDHTVTKIIFFIFILTTDTHIEVMM